MRGLSILPSLLFLLPLCYSATTDTIITGQSINQTQTITSSANKFQLGFTPPTSHNNNAISIAIWCKKDRNQVLVWVAKTENPITDSSGAVFKIGNDGNLQLTDSKGTSHWSTDITSFGTSASTEAVLLDTGNLVLKRDNQIVWQSFDYPTDTLLPGMKLGLDLKTGKNWSLTSGSHALSMDSQGQILEWQDGALDWRGGYWNGDSFNGLPQMRGNKSIYSYSFFNNGTEIYFSYNSSLISRLLLDSTGRLEQYAFEENGETGFWNLSWSRTKSRCQDYSVCGAFAASTCMDDALTVSCSCLQGLEPLNPNDLSVGCWGKSLVECGKVFVPLEKMKLPDKGVLGTGDVSLQECERECVGNCSCVAYAVVNSKCLVWSGNLTDLQQYNGDGQGDVLYLRVSASTPGGSKNKAPVVAIVMAVLGSLLLVGGTFFFWRRARKRGARKRKQELMLQDLGLIVTTTTSTTVEGRENAPELPLLNLQTVSTATENFSIANKLGEGGFGPVYKGKLPKGQEIAVKRLSRRSSQGLEEFKNEVALIAKLQHKNLVRLLGCCVQEEEKMLIYEYMPNKSLDLFLFDPTKRAVLDWGKRFHIIEGIAQGLLYLHRHSRLRIIHRDLKASNILLDGDLNPKISDFGMARIFEGNQNQANTLRVVGTYGYMSPEYALDGRFSEKSDVFSFGVLLLEIISGKKNTGVYHFEQSMNLVGYAWRMWKERRGLELLDPSLDDSLHLHQVLKCTYIGLLCVQEDPGDRPTMSSIIFMLGSEIDISPTPKQPAFSGGKAPTETSSSSSRSRSSINDVTITRVEPR